jgi:MFS family permease
VAIVALAFFAMMTVFVVHGVWLGERYGFGAERLGAVALWLGVADLLGAMVVARFADRFGKRRMLLLGAWISAAVYPLVTGVALVWWAALLGLGVLRFALQLTYISNLAILSEQVPLQRGKVLSIGFTAGQLGLACASLAGPWLYVEVGAFALGAVAAVASLAIVAVASNALLEAPTLEEISCPNPRSPSSP